MSYLSPVKPQFQQIVIPQERPVYRVGEDKFYGSDDRLYEENDLIEYDDEPNENFTPMNSLAMAQMKTYLKKLDAAGQKVAEKLGVAWTSREDAFENAQQLAKEDAKKINLISAKPAPTVMGAKKRGRPPINKINSDFVTPVMGADNNLSLKD